MNIDNFLESLIKREGGYVDNPLDKGGATKYGITQRTLDTYQKEFPDIRYTEVEALPVELAKVIYSKVYFDDLGLGKIPDTALCELVFDCSVLHPYRLGIKWLQRACGVLDDGIIGRQTLEALDEKGSLKVHKDIIEQRIYYMVSIVCDHPSQVVFLKGWLARAMDFIKWDTE